MNAAVGGSGLFQWTQAGTVGTNQLCSSTAVSTITYSPWIPLTNIVQIGILVDVTQATNSFLARMQWTVDPGALSPRIFPETIDGTPATGTDTSGVAVSSSVPTLRQWGPNTAPFLIPRPTIAWAVRVSLFSVGAPIAGDDLAIYWVAMDSAQIQGPVT